MGHPAAKARPSIPIMSRNHLARLRGTSALRRNHRAPAHLRRMLGLACKGRFLLTHRAVAPRGWKANSCQFPLAHSLRPLCPDVLPKFRESARSGVCMAGNSPVYSHGCKSPLPVAEGVAGKPSCRTFGRKSYFRYSSQGCMRAGLHPGDHQPALRRVDRGLRLGTAHGGAAGPAHPPRPHPGDERRKLPPQTEPGDRRVPSSKPEDA